MSLGSGGEHLAQRSLRLPGKMFSRSIEFWVVVFFFLSALLLSSGLHGVWEEGHCHCYLRSCSTPSVSSLTWHTFGGFLCISPIQHLLSVVGIWACNFPRIWKFSSVIFSNIVTFFLSFWDSSYKSSRPPVTAPHLTNPLGDFFPQYFFSLCAWLWPRGVWPVLLGQLLCPPSRRLVYSITIFISLSSACSFFHFPALSSRCSHSRLWPWP